MFEEKLARRIIRSLPKRFDMKITNIEEPHDLSSIKVDEIIGSLQTFEMSINDRSEKKNKCIAFDSNSEGDHGDKEMHNIKRIRNVINKSEYNYELST